MSEILVPARAVDLVRDVAEAGSNIALYKAKRALYDYIGTQHATIDRQQDMIDKLRKRAVEAWHQTVEGTEVPIHEYAYMTLDEYKAWV